MSRLSRHLSTRPRAERGAASLIVVLVLFFVMSLVAAYTSRNLIFEQRTSVNQYRAVQAFEAAEAGVEWALAQLNGGRIGADCLEAGAGPGSTTFRQRYLGINTAPPPDPGSGRVTPLLKAGVGSPTRRAGCVWDGANWICSCPTATDPVLVAPVGAGPHPAFWVSFSADPVVREGVVQIVAAGCTRLDAACLSSVEATINVEGRSLVTALVALKSAVTTPPVAALTLLGGAIAGAGAPPFANVLNTDVSRGGITVHAGGPFPVLPAQDLFSLRSAPGTPPVASVASPDTKLSDLLNPLPADLNALLLYPKDRAFASTFGVWPVTYQQQPAAVTLACPLAGCGAALQAAVAAYPDRVIWVTGRLTVEAGITIGSAASPVTIVVAGDEVANPGNVDLGAGSTIFGLVYSRGAGVGAGPGPTITWAGSGMVQGAAFIEGNLTATGSPTIVFDGTVLDTLHFRSGSFVRVPGGWLDFQQ